MARQVKTIGKNYAVVHTSCPNPPDNNLEMSKEIYPGIIESFLCRICTTQGKGGHFWFHCSTTNYSTYTTVVYYFFN